MGTRHFGQGDVTPPATRLLEAGKEAGILNSLGDHDKTDVMVQKDDPSSGQRVILQVKWVILSHNDVLAQEVRTPAFVHCVAPSHTIPLLAR